MRENDGDVIKEEEGDMEGRKEEDVGVEAGERLDRAGVVRCGRRDAGEKVRDRQVRVA